jgi:hypothetical protein
MAGSRVGAIGAFAAAEDHTMIEGLMLTFSGEELRRLLDARIEHHGACAERWGREKTRTPEDATDDAPLLPEHMCESEAERHVWRIDVLQFIRDHLEPSETYRIAAADLAFGELLPERPESVEQDEYEERTRIGFALERMVKSVDRLARLREYLWEDDEDEDTEPLDTAPGIVEETDEFKTTRVDTGDGPEVFMIEPK